MHRGDADAYRLEHIDAGQSNHRTASDGFETSRARLYPPAKQQLVLRYRDFMAGKSIVVRRKKYLPAVLAAIVLAVECCC